MKSIVSQFEPVGLHNQKAYVDRRSECPETTSDYSFINLFGWGGAYGLDLAMEPDMIWIRQSRPDEKYWAPVGDWKNVDWENRLLKIRGKIRRPFRQCQ